jgi:hydrogenase-4 membrane subunit HyfE
VSQGHVQVKRGKPPLLVLITPLHVLLLLLLLMVVRQHWVLQGLCYFMLQQYT